MSGLRDRPAAVVVKPRRHFGVGHVDLDVVSDITADHGAGDDVLLKPDPYRLDRRQRGSTDFDRSRRHVDRRRMFTTIQPGGQTIQPWMNGPIIIYQGNAVR